MQTDLFSAGFSILFAAVLIVAANAIATECYNKNQDFKDSKSSNYNFSVMSIVFAVFFALLAIYSMYVAWRKPSY